MNRVISVSSLALLITTAVFSATQNGPRRASDPAQGDGGVSTFYIWYDEVPGTPGKLLQQEPLPANLTLANASKSLRVLYTSTDGIDSKTPITVSGAIYLPKGQPPSGGWPVVAWAHGTTGIADVCAPSWAPRSQRDTDYLNAWLAQGFAIAATDYQGLGTPGPHPWMSVKPEAYSVLDSIRSALGEFKELSNSVVIVGQSQGAHAAISASLLAARYAPELKVKGTVATGIPGPAPFVAASWAEIYSLFTFRALDPAFNVFSYMTDAARPVFEAARTGCDAAQVAAERRLTPQDVFTKTPDEARAKAVAFQQYPTPKFAHPLFVGAGLADVTVFPEGQYKFAMSACRAGSTVETHYYPGKDHSGTVNASLADSIPFAKKLIEGQRIAGNCGTLKPPPAGN